METNIEKAFRSIAFVLPLLVAAGCHQDQKQKGEPGIKITRTDDKTDPLFTSFRAIQLADGQQAFESVSCRTGYVRKEIPNGDGTSYVSIQTKARFGAMIPGIKAQGTEKTPPQQPTGIGEIVAEGIKLGVSGSARGAYSDLEDFCEDGKPNEPAIQQDIRTAVAQKSAPKIGR